MRGKILITSVFVLLLGLCVTTNAISQDRVSKIDRKTALVKFFETPAQFYTKFISVPLILDPGRVTDFAVIGPEIATTLEGWYDYMTNGDAKRYLLVDPNTPANIHAIYTTSDSLNPGGSTSRRTKYAFSSDGGNTWTFTADVPSRRSGFGYMALKNDGTAIIANHNVVALQGSINGHVYVDAFPGLGSFTEFATPLTPGPAIWPNVNLMSNNNILIVSESNTTTASDTLYYAVNNGTSTTSYTFLDANSIASNQRWSSAAGANGNAVVISSPVSIEEVLGTNRIYYWKSTNNGTSWGAKSVLFEPFVDANSDTTITFFGLDVIYKPGTTDFFAAFNTNGNGLFKKSCLWISKNGGSPVKIADSSKVPNTATVGAGKTIAGLSGIDHPSLGWSADGNVLYCAYSVWTQDTGVNGWNTRDIYYSFSTDQGTSWSNAIRVTNTPAIDEGYATVSRWNPGTSTATYELHIQYMKDPGDGPTAFNGTGSTAPPSKNWQIYRKITQATVGIKHNATVVEKFNLLQNYPNPFNPTTTIKFALPKDANVTLKIYSINGQEVATLLSNSSVRAGETEMVFDASKLSSGVYFYSIQAGNFKDTKKMILVK